MPLLENPLQPTSAAETPCACGRPLQQHDAINDARIAAALTHAVGDMRIMYGGTTYEVPRQYIVLHGINENDLPKLLEGGIVKLAKHQTKSW